MPAHPEYAIVGNGQWAGVMHRILARQSRVTVVAETRRREGETGSAYQERMGAALAATRAQAAWICVPPGAHTPLLAAAAVSGGIHVVAEKPWAWGPSTTRSLHTLAQKAAILIGVHFEYCLLDAVESWRSQFRGAAGLQFQGRFRISRPDRLGIPALQNLGSHLFAIHAYAAPFAQVCRLECAYDRPDERAVSLSRAGRVLAAIDFTRNREPIIQRFIERFEGAMAGAEFPFTLEFAWRVLETANAFVSGA